MKKEQICDALNLLNDSFIEETDSLRTRQREIQKEGFMQSLFTIRRKWKWTAAAAAACLVLAVFAGSRIFPQRASDTEQTVQKEKLPMLSITENTSDGMGFEGYWAYDISELVNNNPWNEAAQLSALPVYRNQLTYKGSFVVSGADFGKMRELLLDIAGRFGLDADSLTIKDNAPDEEEKQSITEKLDGDVPDGYFNPTELTGRTEGIEITVDQAMMATVSFEPAIALPSQYHFTTSASYKETASVANYLMEKYKDFIHMKKPQINISDGAYSMLEDGTGFKQEYQIAFYDADKSIAEEIINYNFRQIEFCCDENGKLYLASIGQTDLSQKIGDYPVISAEDAKKLLLKGNYITTVPYKLHDETFIAKAELIYRTGAREEYFMPYYRFYVELPEEEREDGLKTYGTYYVPAVKEDYITNMPLWDGNFN